MATCHDGMPGNYHCSFCGATVRKNGTSGGVWGGTPAEIYCCHRCAVSVLPALIADACYIPLGDGYRYAADRTIPNVLASFWRALCARITLRTPK